MQQIRIICPSLSFLKEEQTKINEISQKFLKEGYLLTCGKNVFKTQEFYDCANIEERISDLIDAFEDKEVMAILCGKGGFNVNQLLPFIDFSIIKNNPKIICGMSDLTALLNAIYFKTGITTFLGSNLMKMNEEYTFEDFLKLLKGFDEKTLKSPGYFLEDENKKELNFEIIEQGRAEGTIVAGNLCTLNLLQGTEYLNKKDDVILFIEDDDNYKEGAFFREFDRNLESLLQSNLFKVKSLLFGVFETSTEMNKEKILKMISLKPSLKNIPIAMNINFGHTNPNMTIPIGWKSSVVIDDSIIITFHKTK